MTSIIDNNPANRKNISKAKIEYTRFLKLQGSVLRQKDRVKWLEDGDANTAFFHGITKDRRRNPSIHIIKDMEGNWVEGTSNVANAAVHFFQRLFSAEEILKCGEKRIY